MAQHNPEEAVQIIELGGNIELIGFREFDGGTLVIVKKLVGNYTRKICDATGKFEKLTVDVKQNSDDSSEYELEVKAVIDGKAVNCHMKDKNLFIGLDKALKKVQNEVC